MHSRRWRTALCAAICIGTTALTSACGSGSRTGSGAGSGLTTGSHSTSAQGAGSTTLAAVAIAMRLKCPVSQSGRPTRSPVATTAPTVKTYAICDLTIDGATVPAEVSTVGSQASANSWANSWSFIGESTVTQYAVYGTMGTGGFVVQIGKQTSHALKWATQAAQFVNGVLGGTLIRNVEAPFSG